jgi:hypothetical protein
MKRILLAAALVASALGTTAPARAADVGVSVSIGQPGFYGRLDIGGFPPPPLLYPQPVLIERVPVDRPPIYLRVPPGHAKHWNKHCQEYRACGERVYFVRDEWYTREYAPRYREGRYDRDDRRDERRDYYREERREGRRGDRDEDWRGGGRDHDHDHRHGRGNEQ